MTGASSWILLNGEPLWLLGTLAVIVLGLASGHTSARGLSARARAVLGLVRLAALVCAALVILRPAQEIDLTRAKRPTLAILLDDSASMALGERAPAAAATKWLDEAEDELAELDGLYRVERWALDDPPMPLDREGNGEGGNGEELEPFQRPQSPLARGLEELVRARPDLAGVVLLSDGRDTERPGEEPPTLPVPVYPVLLSAEAEKDVWIENLDTPPVAFIRTPVELRVRLGSAGYGEGQGPGAMTVTLFESGRPVTTETVELGEKGGEVSLVFTPRRTGRKAYRLEVAPRPGEMSVENNRAQFALNVIRDKTRVMLVTGTPTWDVKFLRRRLRQDPSIDLITFLILRTPRDLNVVPQDELSLIPFPTNELFNEELDSFDIVLFANFDYTPYVPRNYLDNVTRFVREAGGGFAMLGGDRSFGLGGYEGTPLAEILPVDLSGAVPTGQFRHGSFRPRLTEAGGAHPIFQWHGDPEKNRKLWDDLPALEGLNWSLRARPGAVVLARNPQWKNEYGPLPVVALGEYGAGRSMAVTTDSLWHWKLPYGGQGGDGAVYRDFWARALRWLSHDPDMELVRLGLPGDEVRQGDRLRLGARVLARRYQPAVGAKLKGALEDEQGRRVPLRWEQRAPGEYVTEPLTLDRQGLWRINVEAVAGSVFLGRDEGGFAVGPPSPEPLRAGVDREYLEALARRTGGRAFEADDGGLVALLDRHGQGQLEVVGRRVDEVWARWVWLLATVALFALDWALRRVWE